MRRFAIVFAKELLDNLRDRRSVLSAMVIGPLLGPAIFLFIMRTSVDVMKDEIDKPLALPVVGQKNAPNLVRFLEDNGVAIRPGPRDPESAVRSGEEPIVLVIPERYAEDFRAGEPATVRLVVDNSERRNDKHARRAERLLSGYSRQTAALRLAARGVSASSMDPVVVDHVDVSTPQARAALFLSMIPYFVIMAGLIGSFYLAADSTAGERERGSLEPLLSTAASRAEIVLGKLAAATTYSAVGLGLSLTAYFTSFGYLPLEEMGMSASLDPTAALRIFGIALPFVFMGAALMVTIASFSKTYKEAQTYLSFITMIPMIPMLYTLFSTPKLRLWMMLTPALSQQLLVNAFLRGDAVTPSFVSTSVASTLLAGVALTAFAIRLYQRERIIG